MSTPATLRPSTSAERTAVLRSSSVMATGSALPPRCRLARNSPILHDRFMLATTLPPTTSTRMSVPPASLMYSCTRMLVLAALKASMIDLGRGGRLRQDHAAPLRALQQLDDAGRAADLLDHVLGAARPVREGRHRQADAFARQELQRPQLVARAADRHALVEGEDALHLELAQHGETIMRDRSADARDHGVVLRQRRPPCLSVGRLDVMFMCTCSVLITSMSWLARARRLDDPPMRIEARVAGEHDELHRPASAAASPSRGAPLENVQSPACPAPPTSAPLRGRQFKTI